MGRRFKVGTTLALASLCTVAAGCGTSSHATKAPAAAPKDEVAPALSQAITQRLVLQKSTLVAASDIPDVQTAYDVRLQSGGNEHAVDRGLDAAGTQPLKAKGGNVGVRVVFHFATPAQAMADVKAFAEPHGGPMHTYHVPGVPGSVAYDDLEKGAVKDRNIAFVIGTYEYRLGWSYDMGATPTQAQLLAMAQAWYGQLMKLR